MGFLCDTFRVSPKGCGQSLRARQQVETTGSDSVSCPLVTERGRLSNDILNHATQPSTV
jgi:hypothetical protein